MEDAAGIKHHRRRNDEKYPFHPGDVGCPHRFQEIGLDGVAILDKRRVHNPQDERRASKDDGKNQAAEQTMSFTKFHSSTEFLDSGRMMDGDLEIRRVGCSDYGHN